MLPLHEKRVLNEHLQQFCNMYSDCELKLTIAILKTTKNIDILNKDKFTFTYFLLISQNLIILMFVRSQYNDS